MKGFENRVFVLLMTCCHTALWPIIQYFTIFSPLDNEMVLISSKYDFEGEFLWRLIYKSWKFGLEMNFGLSRRVISPPTGRLLCPSLSMSSMSVVGSLLSSSFKLGRGAKCLINLCLSGQQRRRGQGSGDREV